jgi:hypothetical protein
MVLSRGYGLDSTKWFDSLTIRGGSDTYGNYIEVGELADTSNSTDKCRRMQVEWGVPLDCDSVYRVELIYRTKDTPGTDSNYAILRWSTTPFDSTGTYKVAYVAKDSTAGMTSLDTLGSTNAVTDVSANSRIYILVSSRLRDQNVGWIRYYDLMVTYRRNKL